MTWQRMGVLRPGAMGAAVATVLRVHGLRTVICREGRSAHKAASCIRVSYSSPFDTRA